MKRFCLFVLLFFMYAISSASVEFFADKKLANKTIVFVSHKIYPYDHHNSATIFQQGEINQDSWHRVAQGGAVLYLCKFDSAGKVEQLNEIEKVSKGIIRDCSVSFDGTKIVYSMRKDFDDSYNLYEYNLSTKTSRQLTFMKDCSDINPTYLPSGEIVFSSTRASKYCACNRHIMCNLYKCDADGHNIIQIGNSIEFENGASVMADGRILYTRWEYVDRNFSGAQGLWTCNPDGTRHALFWGQETNNPVLDAVELSAGKVVAILGSCHDLPWGALAVIDRNIDVEGKHSVVKIYPKEAIKLVDFPDKWSDAMGHNLKIKYKYPTIFDKNTIGVSRQLSESNGNLGLFLVDINSDTQTLIAKPKTQERGWGLFNIKVVEPKQTPPVIPSQCDFNAETATVYVSNVYEGTHMKGVKKGDIKYLRIVENPPKLSWSIGAWSAQGEQAPAMNYHDFDNKIILGVVPVEDDGSAYFEVPSGKFIYLQALDKNMKMIQSMRSGFSAMPNEVVSCAGCHESRKSPPPVSLKASKALRKKPAKIQTFSFCGKLFSYAKMIQPIFDNNCISCHEIGGNAAQALSLSGDKGLVFSRSYMELHNRGSINVIGAAGNAVVQANTWGARHSTLIDVIEEGHVEGLTKEELHTLIAWIDINAPYYPTDDTAFPNNPSGRSPLTADEILELQKLCKVKILDEKYKHLIFSKDYKLELISFDRPDLSDILCKLEDDSPEYKRALEIIKLGAKRLKENPRPDMEGFKISERSKKLINRFCKFQVLEKQSRNALENNKKLKDPNSLE